MRLTIAGGVREEGGDCFLLKGEKTSLIVDAGMKADGTYPRLGQADIQSAGYMLLTQSRTDHAGGLPWLLDQGFAGTIILSAETALQLPYSLPNALCLPVPDGMGELRLPGLTLHYGMSGHCAGALWYHLKVENTYAFFSGDFHFNSHVYQYTPVKSRKADVAVVDSSYETGSVNTIAFQKELSRLIKFHERVLLPVPQHGRGLDILLMLAEQFPDVSVTLDSHMQSEMNRLKSLKKWLRPEAYKKLKKHNFQKEDTQRHVLMLADANLETPMGQQAAKIYAQEGHPILLSGPAPNSPFAQELLDMGKASLVVLPVHNNHEEYKAMKRMNRFERTIPAHSPLRGKTEEVEL